MAQNPERIFIRADNTVQISELKDAVLDTFINNATVTFTVYRQMAVDAVTLAADATLTSATAAFVSGDASRKIIVAGAGVDGSDLYTTILSFTSATEIELAVNATKAVTDGVIWVSVDNALTITMGYVAASDGKYRGTIEDGVPLVDRGSYLVVISIDGGSDLLGHRVIDATAVYRRSS